MSWVYDLPSDVVIVVID